MCHQENMYNFFQSASNIFIVLDFHLSAMGCIWLHVQSGGLLFLGNRGMTSTTCNLNLKEAHTRTSTNDPEKYTISSTISQHSWQHVSTDHLLSFLPEKSPRWTRELNSMLAAHPNKELTLLSEEGKQHVESSTQTRSLYFLCLPLEF